MEYSAYDSDSDKRGIDDPALNQDVTFNKKDDEDFDDTDDFHKFDETDDEDKSESSPQLKNNSAPLNDRLLKETDSIKSAGLNDGNIYI